MFGTAAKKCERGGVHERVRKSKTKICKAERGEKRKYLIFEFSGQSREKERRAKLEKIEIELNALFGTHSRKEREREGGKEGICEWDRS